MLRQALASDIAGIQRVRQSARENRLVSTVVSDADVEEAIEKNPRARWSPLQLAMLRTGISGRCSYIRNMSVLAMGGAFTTRWLTGCGPKGSSACG